ncbi:hypothetical protein ANAEL_03444 [Anaerolineales bacterium]|nr:hypothetical protein ANAEL_03444 [Anaerolineales bacterium]
MLTRTLSRWLMSIVLACLTLVGINLLLANVPAQARSAAALINCSGPIQACIDAANDGDTILIAAGRYTESLTLSKAVSLTGENRDTTIIHAVAYQRVLTVTGAAISNSVVISGLTFTGGDTTNGQGIGIIPHPSIIYWPSPTFTPIPLPATSAQHALLSTPVPHRPLIRAGATGRPIPLSWQTRQSLQDFNPARDGVGGGILITDSARPELQFIRVISNIGGYGGGLYVHSNSTVTLSNLDVLSNVAVHGGGLLAFAPVTLLQVNLGNNYGILGGGAQVSGTMTLSNSTVVHNEGGGLYVEGDLTLQRSNVDFNTSLENWGGGGIILIHGTLNLADSMIEGNQGWPWEPQYPDVGPYWGSGVFLGNSRAWITNTQFLHNSAYKGGGLMLFANSSGQVVNTLFAQNSSTVGGASINIEGKLYIVHSTIADTNLNPQPAIFFEIGTLYITDTKITSHTVGIQLPPLGTGAHEDYNLFFGNITNTVGVITGGHSLIGDPKFVDPLNGDYHLRFDSAAIDHGVDAGVYTDLDGHPRPFGAGFDIGVYEYTVGPRYVATTGHDADNDCLIETNPCATVQHAIDVANDGEQVLIASGLYTQSATLYKPVSLTGVSSDTTILHAAAGQRVLTVTGATISNSVVISGLTFTGGNLSGESYCPEHCGGGVLVTDFAQATIQNVIFSNNAASGAGGGLYDGYYDTAVILLASQFMSNTAGDYGGGAASDGSITLIGGQFISNTSQGDGGGLGTNFYHAPVLITGTHFVNNATNGLYGSGGGVTVFGTVIITGGYFEGNVSHGLHAGGLWANELIITNTDFVSNTLVGSYWGGGVSASIATIFGGRFELNSSGHNGGGLSADFASISGTQFISNTSNALDGDGGGGGAFVVFQSEIRNARFEGNRCIAAGCTGGGMLLWGQSRVANTLLSNNTANGSGAAIATDAFNYHPAYRHELQHLTIASSTSITQPAIAVLSGTLHLTNTVIASHAIAISNTGGIVYEDYNLFFNSLTNTIGVTSGGHSLIGDPQFVDPLHGDYHLRLGSAAIDHGTDAGVYTDLDGNPRPIGPGFDIGAYEYATTFYTYLPLVFK